MGYIEKPNTDATVTLTGAGWANAAGAAAAKGFPSSTNLKVTSTVGNTCTITWTGTALYLLCQTFQQYGPFIVTDNVNGNGAVPVYGDFHCANAPTNNDGSMFHAGYCSRVLIPIVRNAPVASTHVTVLTCAQTSYRGASGLVGLTVDSFVVCDGSLIRPIKGLLVHLGDSQGVQSGTYQNFNSNYPWVNARNLQSALKRPINLTNACNSGECLFAYNGAGHVGGMYRLVGTDGTFTGLGNNPPEFLGILFGANDLRSQNSGGSYNGFGTSPTDFVRHLNSMLCFIEDNFDVAGTNGVPMRVAVASPTFLAPNLMWSSVQSFAAGGTFRAMYPGGNIEGWEQTTRLTKRLVKRFPWALYCPIFEQMAYDDSLCIPNNAAGQAVSGYNLVTYNTDTGLHQNDPGSILIGEEFTETMLYSNPASLPTSLNTTV